MSSEVQIAVIDQQDTQIVLAVPGVQGATGSPVSPGGTANQVLRKASSTNYDTDWSLVTNAMVDSSAAIAGTKISPNFGSQNVVTTGTSTAASFIPTSSSVPTNGVYLPSANNVAISTNGTGRLFVDADGNVILGASSLLSGASGRVLQIGNTSDAASTLQFAATTTGYSYIQFGDSGSPGSYAGYLQYGHTDNFLAIGTNSTEKLRIDSSGRLGLGTSSAADGCLLTLQESASLGAALALRNRNSTQTWRIAVDATAVDDKKLAFIDGTSSTVRMTVTDAGAVGIGTTEPSNSLEVAFSAANSISGITITNGQWFGYGARLQFRNLLTSAGTVGETASIYGEGDGSNAGRLVFHTTAGGTASERARIDSSGRLLVGTSSFSGDGTIVARGSSAGSATQSFLNLQRGQTNPTGNLDLGIINFTDAANSIGASITAATDGSSWGASDYPTRLTFSTTADGASSPTEALRITSAQDLMISQSGSGLFVGTTADGAYRIGRSSFAVSSGTLYIGNAAIQVSSDVRLKKDIEDTNLDALAAISKIKVKDFTWDDPTDTSYNNRNARGKWTGLIAQELIEVLPFVVNAPRKEEDGSIDHDSESVWTLDQSQLCPVLIKAIQQQQEIIANLEARLSALEAQ